MGGNPVTVESATAITCSRRCAPGLADPARLSCLLAVREQPRTVSVVVATTGLSQPNVSKHLACLRECGLVQASRSGRFVSYRLANGGVETLVLAAEQSLSDVGEQVSACPNYGEEKQG